MCPAGGIYSGAVAKELIFIPIARSELGAIDGSLSLKQRPAHRVTPELLAALEYSPEQQEDAEYAAVPAPG